MPPEGPASALAEAFGLGQPLAMGRVARGALGAVWRLATAEAGGPRVTAVKELFFDEPPEASVEREVAFTAACRSAGVTAPAALRKADGGLRHRAGSLWRAYEWVDGEVPDWEDVPTTRWLAGRMAAVHQLDWKPDVDGPADEMAQWYERVDVDWPALIKRACAAGISGHARLRERLPDLVATTAFVDQVPTGRALWSHRDMNPNNVIKDAAAYHLVDWDNAGPLDPVRDLAMVFMHCLTDLESLPGIHGAYVEAGGPARVTGPESLATGAVIYLGFLASQVDVLLDLATSADDREFAGNAVRNVTESVPTVAQLEAAARAILRG